jgi:hypothetical protein
MQWCLYCFNHHDTANPECHKQALKVMQSETFWSPEPIIAYRGFQVVYLSDFTGNIFDRTPVGFKGARVLWEMPDPGPAECKPITKEQANYALAHPHTSPHPMCGCGYHALRLKNKVSTAYEAIARVELSGFVMEHENGWRSERIKVVGMDSRSTMLVGPKARKAIAELKEKYQIGDL